VKRRISTVLVGLASVAVLIAAPSALAAYTTVKLEVQQAGAVTTFRTTQSSNDDATAVVRIFVPSGTSVTATQAPGTMLGSVEALLKLHALAGAEVPVEGNVVVAPPGSIAPAVLAACLQGATPTATWVLALNIAGTPVNLPLFLVPTSGAQTALGPAYIQACLASPYIPTAQGGAAAGAQLVNAEFSVQGVFSRGAAGAFVAIWVPWTPGSGTPNTGGTTVTPAAVGPGAVSLAARRAGAGAVITGRVTQGGQPRGGATVTIFGGPRASALRRLGRVQVRATGSYSFRARAGTFFRARAVAATAAAAPLCTALGTALTALGNPPCVNPTTSGFTAQSRFARKR
jgi:hypothetical protein